MKHLACLAFLLCALVLPVSAQLQVTVVNAASFELGLPVSPGCWATAFGDFASVGVVDTPPANTLPFPNLLGGVQVFVNDVASPMNFVNGRQINFLVPRNTPTQGKVSLRITVAGSTVFQGTINMWPVSPGLISLNPADQSQPGAVLNQDGTLNSQQNPARRGEVVQIFGVGADFSELPDDGAAAPGDRLIETITQPTVYVSIIQAVVQFSGLAPQLVNAWQLNVFVPNQSFITGQVPIIADLGGLKSNLVSIWVAP